MNPMEHTEPTFPILVADIGGTNANFGIVDRLQQRYRLRAHYQLSSQNISDFTLTVMELLKRIASEHHLHFSAMVIGGSWHVSALRHMPCH